jgi:signal transduction histidine kinase
MRTRDLPHIRVLLIEDDEDDRLLIGRFLAEVPLAKYEVTWAPTCDAGLNELDKGTYDVCLLDYHLGPKTGLDILMRVEKSPNVPPIIILTGQGDYLVDLRSMEYGAADYLVKNQMNGFLLERAIRYSIDRKRAKDALQESERQNRHLASALLKVQENERRMLASELHDELGQLLVAVKLSIENAVAQMEPEEICVPSLKMLIPSIQEALDRIRNIYTQLLPTVLGDLGILAALRWFCREFQNDHPEIAVEPGFDVEENEIPAELKLMIFRIVQDALQNVVEGGKSRNVQVNLDGRNGHIALRIENDGAGLDVSQAMNHGTDWGLRLVSMKKRAELSGGSFQIESSDGRGTLVSIRWLPVKQ